ncbi:MAG: hypothetical protein ACLUFH_13650 [Monoglobales bacterium]|uniref:hypothetical protein n=1 Tax=Candidatus Ventrimonas sp. TaxID=3048889 RepID=UPI003A365776
MRKRNSPAVCPSSILLSVIEEDLQLGICCDIYFTWRGKKHMVGVWGDDGNTYKNLCFYLDKNTFSSLEELKSKAVLEQFPLFSLPEPVIITECDGCYPESTPLLASYCQET